MTNIVIEVPDGEYCFHHYRPTHKCPVADGTFGIYKCLLFGELYNGIGVAMKHPDCKKAEVKE